QRGQLRLAYVATRANTADIFTKALPPGDHQPYFALAIWPCDPLFSPTLPMGGPPISSLPVVPYPGNGSGGGGSGGGRGVARGASRGSVRCLYVIRTCDRAGKTCVKFHTQHRCFSRLDDAWRVEFGDEAERLRWLEQLRYGVDIFAIDYDAILAAMYALTVSAEGDCYLCVPPDPGIEAAALGASESTLPSIASAEALHTFMLDPGASRCFFCDRTTLTPLLKSVPARLDDCLGGPVLACSFTVLPCPAVPSGSLSGLHLPSFFTNLVNTAALEDAMVTTTSPGGDRVRSSTSPLLVLPPVASDSPLAPPPWSPLPAKPSWLHSRLLVSGLPRSVPPPSPSPAPPCLPCIVGRQRAAPHSSSFPSTTAPLQTLHMDGWGPTRVSGQGRERFFLLVIDDYTRYTTVFPLHSKGEVPDVLTPWICVVCLQLRERFREDLPVLRLHSDRGGEFSSDLLREFCRGEGILQFFTLPASPQQNGFAQRRIGLVMAVARTSMIHVAAPHILWPFAVRQFPFTISSPTTLPLSPPRPLFLAPGPPSVDPLPPQGPAPSGVSQVDPIPLAEPVEVTVDSGATGVGAARGAVSRGAEPAGAKLGGAEPASAELGGPEPEGAEPGAVENEGAEFGVPLPSPPASSLANGPYPESDLVCAASPTVTRLLATIIIDPLFESAAASALVAELVDFSTVCRLDYTAEQEDFECLAAAVTHLVAMLLAPEGDLDAPDIRTLCSYAEAIEGPYSSPWQIAMDAEMASWIKRQGVDFFQTFSPTPKMTTLRVLLHVAAQRDYELHSLDFSTAFSQGSLHEEIWLRGPPGFTGSFPAGPQWSLQRPVYGLRQAPREWHETPRTMLAALGFAPSTADPSLFLRTVTSLPLFYVLVYVDDFVFAIADTEALALVKSELQKRHTCTDLGELRSYLGLQITQDRARRTITLTQSHMVHQVLQRFGFRYSSPYTSGMGLVLGGRGPVVLTGHADASWVDDLAMQRSSSCEAEIYAGAMAAQELRWLTYLLTDLGERPRSPPVLYVDNKAMIALCQEHRLEHMMKHIALRYFLARELQHRGQLRLAYMASRANTADVFGKALQPGDHQRFCTVLGLVLTLPHLLTA
ncbi:unnamed protein product, partial [Closterium sp. NIES-53]